MNSIAKRLFDVSISFLSLVLLSPLYLLLSILIKVKTPGPIFFQQKRIGKDGKTFIMIKFRTMVNNHGGNSISVKGESRITPLGATLRKYKLDELPEMWNILKGEMSIVGPRPDVPGYADLLLGEDRIILSIKPGLTGPASLKFVNEEELLAKQNDPKKFNDEILYPAKVKINKNYIQHWSFWLDLKIILFTLFGKSLSEQWANPIHEELNTHHK